MLWMLLFAPRRRKAQRGELAMEAIACANVNAGDGTPRDEWGGDMIKRLFGGRGASGKARGSGRMGGTRPGAGPGGECVCPRCGHRITHQIAHPCNHIRCPQCGSFMARA